MPKFTLYHMEWKSDLHLELRGKLYDHEEGAVELDRSHYSEVAEVMCTTLEGLFRKTNTIDHPWWENPGVKIIDLDKKGFRSTSVTDVAEEMDGPFKGRLWVCAPVGWLPAKWKEERRG